MVNLANRVRSIKRVISRMSGYGLGCLSIGAIVGSGAGWLFVTDWIIQTNRSMEDYWRVPGHSASWIVYGTTAGAIGGTVVAAFIETVVAKVFRRHLGTEKGTSLIGDQPEE